MQPAQAVASISATFSSGLRDDLVPEVALQPSNKCKSLQLKYENVT